MIPASDIALFLGCPLTGPDLDIEQPRSLASAEPNSLVFLSRPDREAITQLNVLGSLLCLTTPGLADKLDCPVIIVDNPRLAFARILNAFFVVEKKGIIADTAHIDPGARVGRNVTVGPGCHIGASVVIGQNTEIGSCVVVKGTVHIGDHCIIKSNTTIGEPGFGFVRDDNNIPVRFPHLGSVTIGDHVEIGANCTVVRAALDTTVIGEHVKIDDHVHVAHNCQVGKGTFIAAGAVLSGSTTIGQDSWIAPNATIIDYCTVGDNAFIGLGSVVTKPVSSDSRVFGIPARPIGSRRRTK